MSFRFLALRGKKPASPQPVNARIPWGGQHLLVAYQTANPLPVTANPTPDTLPNPTRSIVLLAVAGFASQARCG